MLPDVTPEMRARHDALVRRASPIERFRALAGLVRGGRKLMKAGVRLQFPDSCEGELRALLIARMYGPALAARRLPKLPESAPLRETDITDVPMSDVALRAARAFEQLGIPYFLGGSVASSIHGQARFTNDLDFVVRLAESQIEPLIAALGPDFDVDEVALKEAIRSKRSWNIFFLPQFVRIDLFMSKDGEFEQNELRRRRPVQIAPDSTLFVEAAEDLILRKLLWYRDGGGTSEQQLRDVIEILRIQIALDTSHLDDWAARLGISDLLQRARRDSFTPR